MSALPIPLLLLTAGATFGWAVREWHRRDRLAAGLLTTAGLVAIYLVSPLLIVGLGVTGGVLAYQIRRRSSGVVRRWGQRMRRGHGVATTLDVVRHASWVTVRRHLPQVRPSLRHRVGTRTREVAAPLCRVGMWRVWISYEDVVLVFGRPRSGKTGWLLTRVLDAPGAVLATSTRTDIYELTAGLRDRKGPVWVFNPSGLGDIPSNVGFNPLWGCRDPGVAAQRATDLLSASSHRGAGDHEYWLVQARRVLTALLHAAAIGELTMHAVARWMANPDDGARQIVSLLRRSPAAAAYVPDAEQFVATNSKTRSSITATIMPCLGWLATPSVAATLRTTPLDVATLLRDHATVYLLGGMDPQIAPLVTAMTGYVARQARVLAAQQPTGRLDPPLSLVLDEAALICPVPLHEWTADMGGRGVSITAALQSRAQLTHRWGDSAARIILGNAGAVMCFALGSDVDDLTHWSRLAGERDELTHTRDAQERVSSQSTRRVAVLTPTQLATLPRGRVVVYRRGLPPVLGRVRMAWTRWDVRTHQRVGITPAPTPAGVTHPTPPIDTNPGVGVGTTPTNGQVLDA
jgi:type IV secretion system protein VirD4